MISNVDYKEVARKAYELEAARGPEGARRCAAEMAAQALIDGEVVEQAFWHAVEMSLTTR